VNNMSQPLKGFNTVRVPCLECNVGFLMSSRRVDGNGNTYENWSHGLDSPCPINFTLDVMWASYLKRGYFLSSISWWGRLKPKDDGVITLFPLLDAFVEAYGATGTVCQYSVPEWAVVAGIRNGPASVWYVNPATPACDGLVTRVVYPRSDFFILLADAAVLTELETGYFEKNSQGEIEYTPVGA
jgi:hypothetical protein